MSHPKITAAELNVRMEGCMSNEEMAERLAASVRRVQLAIEDADVLRPAFRAGFRSAFERMHAVMPETELERALEEWMQEVYRQAGIAST